MKKYTILLLLSSGILSMNMSAQAKIKTESNKLKITYEYSHPLSEKMNFDAELYVGEGYSQFVYASESKKIKLEDGFEYTSPFYHYIDNYYFQTQKVEDNRFLEDGTPLYATWNNAIEWEITDEEHVINGFKVRKATTDSFEKDPDDQFYPEKAIAWFAPEIPIPSGPVRYYGLPGLIIRLEYENAGDMYTVKNIDPNTSYNFQSIDKENQVNKEDIIQYRFKDYSKIKKIQKAYNKRNK